MGINSRRVSMVCAWVLAALAGQAQGAVDQAPPAVEFDCERLLVRFDDAADPKVVGQTLIAAGVVEVVFEYSFVPGLICVRVEPAAIEDSMKALAASPLVRYVERDPIVHAQVQDTPYGITMVNAPAAWPTYGKGAGARVAVLDTGVQFGHPDLPAPVLSTSFINGEAVDDFHSHGTHVSGTVLALDNDIGVVGVAPEASLMIGKVLANSGSGSTSGVMAGVDWAATNGANVINMSLGGGGFSQGFLDLAQQVFNANVVIVASAGNSAVSNPSYPGAYEPIISVVSLTSTGALSSFSNFGPTVDVAAPGSSVRSTIPLITSEVTWGGTPRSANILTGSAIANASGQVIYCGLGESAADYPASVAGNIAHVRRGAGVSFFDKADRARDAGAVGVVISNNVSGNFTGTLNATFNIPVVAISQADGNTLEAASGVQGSITIQMAGSGYGNKSGTSMASPHVAGVAGMLYSIYGSQGVTSAQVRQAIEQSATDLGDPGRDDTFGHGLVNVVAASEYLAGLLNCLADFNGSGGTPDDADVAEFFTAWNAGETRADVNGSGGTPDDADVTYFFERWNAGC
ncbi:MAG: S8 family serine peptidase [Phycisphaerales bacterium]|nr:S8 family serine peptidase [Phycisphaerales bacterium]